LSIPAASCARGTGHRIGKGYVALGDGLAGPAGGGGDGGAFRGDIGTRTSTSGCWPRWRRAADAGGLAGGQGPVAGALGGPWSCGATVLHNELDLRSDWHDDAIGELRRIHADYKPTIAYYDERARNPRHAITGVAFAEKLKRQQGKEIA
jgi:uncharacterized Ntn-hydrolase superfamily protein